jgi:hypothetical protein
MKGEHYASNIQERRRSGYELGTAALQTCKASGEHQKGVTAGRTHDSQHLAPRNINYKNLPDHHLNAQDKQIVQQYTGNQAAQTSMPTSQPARSPISNLNK